MFQTVLLGGSFDANIPRLPPQTVVAGCSPQQMEQLLAQTELEGGNVVANHPSPEDVLLAPLLAPLASQHHNSEYSMHKNPNGVSPRYCPLSIALPHHTQSLREKQAAFLGANGSELFYSSTDHASKSLSTNDIHRVPSLEDVTPTPLTPASPHGLGPTISVVGPNLGIIEATNSSILMEKSSMPPLSHPGRMIPELTPPLSNLLSRDLDGALASSLDRFGTGTVRPPLENWHHTSPNAAIDHCPQPKTSKSHPINVTAIVPLNVLSILSSNLRNNLWSESVAPQRMSSVFSVPPDLVLPHLVSLSPVALMALEVAQSLREPSVAYQDPGMETQTCPFLHNSRPLAAILGNEKPLSNPRWLSCNGILVDKQQRPRSAPNVAMCHSADLVSTFSAITPSTYQPVCGVNCFATPQSGFYHVGEFGTATPRKHRPMLGNMVLSSCPGKKVRLNSPTSAPVIGAAALRSATNRDLTADLERIASLGVKLIINCLSDEELTFLGAPWPNYIAAARKLGIDVLRMPMPEGLAPLNVEDMDKEIARIITQCTTKGIDVLAHCRGGIGRAGLVACCWMIKLGVCGTLTAAPKPQTGFVRHDTLALVESAIKIVRQRRSLKAIETYEQVKFLVDFVDYLRQKPLIALDSKS